MIFVLENHFCDFLHKFFIVGLFLSINMSLENIAYQDFEQYRSLVKRYIIKKDVFTVSFMATIMASLAATVLYAQKEYDPALILSGIAAAAVYGGFRAGREYRKARKAVDDLEQQLEA